MPPVVYYGSSVKQQTAVFWRKKSLAYPWKIVNVK